MKTILFSAALIAAFASSPALAQSPGAGQGFVVRHADLNLGSEAGIRALDRRLANAIANACGTPSSADPRSAAAVRQCRADTRAAVEAQRAEAIAAARRSPTLASRR